MSWIQKALEKAKAERGQAADAQPGRDAQTDGGNGLDREARESPTERVGRLPRHETSPSERAEDGRQGHEAQDQETRHEDGQAASAGGPSVRALSAHAPAAPGAGSDEDRWPRDAAETRVVKVPRGIFRKRKIVALDETDPVTDRFKTLRTRIFQRMRPHGWNTLQVTGFGAGEGKSLVAANLAVSIAQDARQTTLLVDLDFRDPSLQDFFGLGPAAPGLRSYFLDGVPVEDLFVNPGIDGLTLLPAGGRMANAPELLGSPRMEALIKELKARYRDRYILFDTPPVNLCPDPVIVSEYVDALLLVARADRTLRDGIQAAMELVPQGKVLGIVLNGSRKPDPFDTRYRYYGRS
jgi:capsular exopolysaccharide synthesis family protein